MTFSIIVPCYNTAVWLENCLNSIVKQTYKDWEMLLVNDGSTDDTADIMHIYAEKDTRIKIINQENQGVSVARNKAIQKARGEYLIFLDSDDQYKDENCLEQITKVLNNNVDIVVFRYQTIQDKKSVRNKNTLHLRYFEKMSGHTYTGEEYLQTVLSENEVYQWFPWLYVFKRLLWTENKFQFDKELWILEDMDIIYKVILKAQKIKVLNYFIYQYQIREGSATQLRSKKLMQDELNVSINNIKEVNSMNICESTKKLLNSNFSYIYFAILKEVNYLEKNDRKEIITLLSKNQNLMNHTIRNKNVFVKKLINILGICITSKLLFICSKCERNKYENVKS